MTPEQAQELLGGTTPAPWHVHIRDRHFLGETETWLYVGDTPALPVDHQLMSAAPALAEQIANMHYEYAVQVLMGDGEWYFADEDSLPFGSLKPYEVRWGTKEEAKEIHDSEVDYFDHDGIRIVRRLVSTPEVVE